jgi:hypothetical protein
MPSSNLDYKTHKSDWHPCKQCNSMVCDNLCSTQRRKLAASQSGTDSSPPPPYSKKVKSDKSDSEGGEAAKR